MEELSIGVISGLVASLIIFIFQLGYVRIFRPWFEEFLYRDLKIEGRWHVEFTSASDFSEVVELKRQGHRVSGTVTVTQGPDQGRIYIIDGSFKNLILTLSFSGQDETRLDRGTYTLQVHNNGQHLDGYSAFYQDEENKITCLECIWKRQSS